MKAIAMLAVSALVAGCAVAQAQRTPAMLKTVEQAVAAARADAIQRLGAPAGEDMKIVEAKAVTWRDGSLGCPRPGIESTQALVPGYRVRLLVRGETWDYHASVRGTLILCPPGRGVDPLPDPRT